jgi:hypothetical protein
MAKSDDKAVGKRLEGLIEEMRIKSIRAFALSINTDPSLFSKVLKSVRPISDSMVKELKEKYGVNPDWLLYGRGEKFGQIPNNDDGNYAKLSTQISISREQYIKDIIQTKSMVKTLLHLVADLKAKEEGRPVSDILMEIHEKNTNDLIDLTRQYSQGQ